MNANRAFNFPRFRDDLSIQEKGGGSQAKVFSVFDPLAGEHYEFDERTFYLCRSFDGVTTAKQIVINFNTRFANTITISNLIDVFDELLSLDLLAGASPGAIDGFRRGEDDQALPSQVQPGDDAAPDRRRNRGGDDDDDDDSREYRWPLFDPSALYSLLSSILAPARLLFLLIVYSLFITLPIALFAFFGNQLLISQDMAALGGARSYFGRLLFSLFSINLLRCLIQGILITYFGGRVKTFGIRLRFGIIPRFYIDKSAIRQFDREAKLWSYGSNLLFRMVLIVLAVLIWQIARSSGTQLAVYAIILTHAAIISLLLVSLPLRSSDGYRWMVTFFRLPPSLIKLGVMVFLSRFTGKSLPTSISPKLRRNLFFYGLALFSFWTYAFFRITSHISAGLIKSFPLLFGEATEIIITTVVVLLVIRWGVTKFGRIHPGNPDHASAVDAYAGTALTRIHEGGQLTSLEGQKAREAESPWIRRGIKILVLASLVLFLALPYPFRPGGPVSLLPPVKQAIQAPVSGKITEVLQNGGDGELLSKGALVATMTSSTLESSIRTLQEQVLRQEAEVEKQSAILQELLVGARPEEINQARALAGHAAEQVVLAQRQLETANVTWRYSVEELDRINRLPAGVISGLEVSRSEKQAEVDRMRINEFESNLAAQKKKAEEAAAAQALLLKGASEQEIEVARQELAGAQAELRRVKEELKHARDQASSGRLIMPFKGYLVDAYLKQKLGSYLNVGETYATAQTHQRPMVELLLPEYEVGEMTIGSEAEVRLMAFPNESFTGHVVSIEPSGQPAEFGQVFKVVIELSDLEYPVRPGMTGYAKVLVGKKPLYVIVTRPVMRFFQIEGWSWLP